MSIRNGVDGLAAVGPRRWLTARITAFRADSGRAWRESGLQGLLQEWRESIVFPTFRHGRLLIIEQDLSIVKDVPVPHGVTMEIVPSCHDWMTFAGIATHREIIRMQRAADRGRTCLAAWKGDDPIGYTWISDRVEPDVEWFPVPLPRDAAYGWNLYVTPSERSTGVGSALVGGRLRVARDRGFRHMWRVIDATNRATVRTVQKTWAEGSRMVGQLRYVRVFGRSFGRVDRAVRSLEFTGVPFDRNGSRHR